MSTIAEPFKALGAGNGFTFCRKKAFSEADADQKPISVLTLKQAMAWYWLLKDFELGVELNAIADPPNQIGFNGVLTVKFVDFFSATHSGTTIVNPLGELFDGEPKDRAVLNDQQRAEFLDGEMSAYSLGNNGTSMFSTTGNVGDQDGDVDLTIEWFDDDSCGIVFSIAVSYVRFILTNFPVTSKKITDLSSTPINLGTVSTAYGDLTAYDCTNDTNAPGYIESKYSAPSFTFTSKFFTFS